MRTSLLPRSRAASPWGGPFFVPGTWGQTRRQCKFRVTLQPQEQMQARYRFGGPCPAGVTANTTFEATLRAMTAEDLTQDRHAVTLRSTC